MFRGQRLGRGVGLLCCLRHLNAEERMVSLARLLSVMKWQSDHGAEDMGGMRKDCD
jgi:hypothetical protein